MEAEKLRGVKVTGHRGKWYSIDSQLLRVNGKINTYYMMEHETYGDEADWIVIDENGTVIMENLSGFLYGAWGDFYESFGDVELTVLRD